MKQTDIPKCPRCKKNHRTNLLYCYRCQVPVYLDVRVVEYPPKA